MAVKSVIFQFSISVLPRSINAPYAVIGLPPSLAGFVHLTVMEVASMSTVTVGEPGASEEEQNRSANFKIKPSQLHFVSYLIVV